MRKGLYKMAANILRFLNELANDNEKTQMSSDMIIHGLDYSVPANSLELDDYVTLHDSILHDTRNIFINKVNQIIPRYLKEYYKLDCPRTFEEWSNKKYEKSLS
jgi:hypothetical protein